MIQTIILSMCLAASSLSLNARAQDEPAYTEGPVTEVDYIQVEYSCGSQGRDAGISVSGAAYCLGRSGVGIEVIGTP